MKAKFIRYFTFSLLMCAAIISRAQNDSTLIHHRIKRFEANLKKDSLLRQHYDDMTFYYNQMFSQKLDSVQSQMFKLSGYVDAYYAYYSDSTGLGQYQKFPTAAPVSNAFALNMLMLSGQYRNKNTRATISLHYGDIAASAWSSTYNLIQEANCGMKMGKRLWLDAGFFRTHLGFESIQPRENITTSIATTTYFEPYYLSGAKLSYTASPKLVLQASVFNGFNTYVETNKKKTFGLTANYEFNADMFLSINVLATDESMPGHRSQPRLYNNIYLGRKSKHLDLGVEINYGIQQNSQLGDSTKTATMYSALAAAKYKFLDGRMSVYGRFEVFEDSDEILTGPVQSASHQLVGINVLGGTIGVEYKPLPKSYLRLEYRQLDTEHDENIFRTNGANTFKRSELICSMGVWF